MAYYHVDAMPVLRDDTRLVGVVTRGDILRGFAENPRLNLWG
jgi:CBS domain-containing protein